MVCLFTFPLVCNPKRPTMWCHEKKTREHNYPRDEITQRKMAAIAFENAGSVAVLGRARCHTHELNKAWWRLGTKWICDVLLERTGARRASLEDAKPVCLHACDERKTITNKGRVVILTDAQSLRVTTESLATQWSHQFALHLIH